MNWSKVHLIFLRETRDQLRDRRTLFTVLVLPLFLYPLMAIVMVQVSQFMREHPTQVRLFGVPSNAIAPPLLKGTTFHPDFSSEPENRLLLIEREVERPASESLSDDRGEQSDREQLASIQRDIRAGRFDAAVLFPHDFESQLLAFQNSLQAEGPVGPVTDTSPGNAPSGSAIDFERDGNRGQDLADDILSAVPSPLIVANSTNDKSRMAADRLERVLVRWREAIIREHLRSRGVSPAATQPFRFQQEDVAAEPSRRVAIWSKFMPFVVLIWALTGAFYPAVDLCAGEKERGTLETLLSSPAERSEIVWGKLLTVMVFSVATALLNMLSMGATTLLFLRHFAATADLDSMVMLSPPPLSSVFWVLMALIPASAFFSALALSIAAFARSSKEGHYYLMPLLFIILPLMLFPTLPTVELTLGTSIIPLAGLMLLLRAVMEGEYLQTLIYFVPVTGVTAACCLLAIRWAIDQFSSESVLFRESERGGITAWIRHAARQRGPTPKVSAALLGGILILMIKFFVAPLLGSPETVSQLIAILLITQIGMIALPALLLTYFLTRSPRETLLLNWPNLSMILAAFALGFLLNPVILWLGVGVQQLYPLDQQTLKQLEPLTRLLASEVSWGLAILLIGLLPAICEELAFRGFILSGLRHLGHRWGAIVLSAGFFGLTHGLLQQQITATLIGVVIGYLAIQSGSLLPAVLFHFTHNSLVVLSTRLSPELLENQPWTTWIVGVYDDGLLIRWPVAVVTGLLAIAILNWFRKLPSPLSAEEQLTHVLGHQSQPSGHLPARGN
jgi:sodium transport system permease protein